MDTKKVVEKSYTQKEVDEMLQKQKEELRKETVWFIAEKSAEIAEKKAESLALVKAEEYKELSPTMKKFQEEKEMVQYYANWGALPSDLNEAKLMMMKELAKPLWLWLMECISWMAFINWKPTIYGSVYLSLLTKKWINIEFLEKTSEKCKVKLTNENWKSMEWYFDKTMAVRAGIWKNVYLKYPETMLSYKAIREAQKFLCPEILGWMNLVEEEQEILDNKPIKNGSEEKVQQHKIKLWDLSKKYNNIVEAESVDGDF